MAKGIRMDQLTENFIQRQHWNSVSLPLDVRKSFDKDLVIDYNVSSFKQVSYFQQDVVHNLLNL